MKSLVKIFAEKNHRIFHW